MSVSVATAAQGLSLLVHDEAAYFRRALRGLLVGEGFRRIDASEDFQTLQPRLAGLCPDILILSWEPDSQGRKELIQAIRGRGRAPESGTKIIAATACSRLDFIKMVAASGVNGVILKPFNAKTVISQVRRMADQRAAEIANAMREADGFFPYALQRQANFNRR